MIYIQSLKNIKFFKIQKIYIQLLNNKKIKKNLKFAITFIKLLITETIKKK